MSTWLRRLAAVPGSAHYLPMKPRFLLRGPYGMIGPRTVHAPPNQNLLTKARAAALAGEPLPPKRDQGQGPLGKLVAAIGYQARKFSALSGRFMPMVFLFFLMAFVNTILDSLKDTLVITAAGGGAQVGKWVPVT